MAVLSMTGFGHGEVIADTIKVTVELSTVNRKQFDCNLSLPRELLALESELQTLIHTRIARGYVKATVTIAAVNPGILSEGALAAVQTQITTLRSIAAALNLKDDLTASSLLRISDATRTTWTVSDVTTLRPAIEEATRMALDALLLMRTREGAALEQDLRTRFSALEAIRETLVTRAPTVPRTYKQTLERRLNELLNTGATVDATLIAREVAVFADRCDVSEELTRLASHFQQAYKALATGTACGRTLDFLCQEMFREINTIGSKANDAEITASVITFKAGLEAAREQIQNLE